LNYAPELQERVLKVLRRGVRGMPGSQAAEKTGGRLGGLRGGTQSSKKGGRRQLQHPAEVQDVSNPELDNAVKDSGQVAGGEAELLLACPV
jgi:hypothetical protein